MSQSSKHIICCCGECESILQRQCLSHMRSARTSRAASLHGTMMKAKEQMTTSAVRVPIWPALNWESGDHDQSCFQHRSTSSQRLAYHDISYNDISTFDRKKLPCSHSPSGKCPTLLQEHGHLIPANLQISSRSVFTNFPGSMKANSNPFLRLSASLIPPATSHVFFSSVAKP